ncbi:hypothetical protein N7532_002151 [Penicillium argentinense]|uniref:alpha-galactosidase n=1 Tax=Penicillium argentinense TaxID=1131581 RepID=A0A9W9KN39_9EURO|nr:uncharacterized protein N7532_002151 [Penicillium argentinense]KAJ5111616.1 hypothetical protein N7532_002151 [Penicillium argentinense]
MPIYQSTGNHWRRAAKTVVIFIIGLAAIALLATVAAPGGPAGRARRMNARAALEDDDASESTIWQPAPGLKWQIQLENAVDDTSVNAEVYDIDLFDNTADTIRSIRQQGAKVICYFSAGTYEDWRSDAEQFAEADMGNELDGWPGERWLNIRSASVHRIIESRLDMAHRKGCDGVDPDNIDAYNNENGLGLTEADAVDFIKYLAAQSHANGGDIIGSVIENVQWSVNEQCAQYDECDTYAAFTRVNKPVFHIEYSDELSNSDYKIKARMTNSEKSSVCDAPGTEKFSTVIKDLDLSAWVEYC